MEENDDKESHKKERNIIPRIKNIEYLNFSFILTFEVIFSARSAFFCILISSILLSDKNINFIIIMII